MNFTMWELNLCLGTHIPKRTLPKLNKNTLGLQVNSTVLKVNYQNGNAKLKNITFGDLPLSLAAMR